MGLDMYAYKTMAKPEKEVDFDTINFDESEIHYWRKHANLHGWMQDLYYEKDGQHESFNCVNLLLTEKDLDDLEYDIKNGNLPQTSGFFFGQSDGSENEDDLQFIEDARLAILDGFSVYYTSWW
jgi:hypothetical protein